MVPLARSLAPLVFPFRFFPKVFRPVQGEKKRELPTLSVDVHRPSCTGPLHFRNGFAISSPRSADGTGEEGACCISYFVSHSPSREPNPCVFLPFGVVVGPGQILRQERTHQPVVRTARTYWSRRQLGVDRSGCSLMRTRFRLRLSMGCVAA